MFESLLSAVMSIAWKGPRPSTLEDLKWVSKVLQRVAPPSTTWKGLEVGPLQTKERH